MDNKEFARLAEAYGGDLRRWPADAQASAARLALEPGPAALLAGESDLDLMLSDAPATIASAAVRERILAAAPRPRTGFQWALRLGVGASLAGACAAGVMMGLLLVAPSALVEPGAVAISTLSAPVGSTAFGPAPEAAAEAQES